MAAKVFKTKYAYGQQAINALLAEHRKGTNQTIIGDVNQLPSVRHGALILDLESAEQCNSQESKTLPAATAKNQTEHHGMNGGAKLSSICDGNVLPIRGTEKRLI